MTKYLLVDQKSLRVGDAQHILLVGVTLQDIAGSWMSRQQLGGAGIELDLLVDTDVYLREIVTVEVRLQYLTVLDDALLLPFHSWYQTQTKRY